MDENEKVVAPEGEKVVKTEAPEGNAPTEQPTEQVNEFEAYEKQRMQEIDDNTGFAFGHVPDSIDSKDGNGQSAKTGDEVDSPPTTVDGDGTPAKSGDDPGQITKTPDGDGTPAKSGDGDGEPIGIKKRLNRLRKSLAESHAAEKQALEAKNAEMAAELAKYQQQQSPTKQQPQAQLTQPTTQQGTGVEEPPMPIFEDYPNSDAWVDDYMAWTDGRFGDMKVEPAKAASEAQKPQPQPQQVKQPKSQQTQQSDAELQRTAWLQRRQAQKEIVKELLLEDESEDADEIYTKLEPVLNGETSRFLSDTTLEKMVADDADALLLVREFAKRPRALERINLLDDGKPQAQAIEKLLTAIKGGKGNQSTNSNSQEKTKPPLPEISTSRGNSARPTKGDIYKENLSFESYEKLRSQQVAEDQKNGYFL